MSCTCTSEPANPAEDNFLPVYTIDPKCPIHGHTSAPPAPSLKEHFKNSINMRPPQRINVGKGDINTEPAPSAPAAPQLWPATKGEQAGYDAVVKASAAQETAERFWEKWKVENTVLIRDGRWANAFAEAYATSRVQGLEERLANAEELAQRVAKLVEGLPIYSTSSSMYRRYMHVKRLLAVLTEDSSV